MKALVVEDEEFASTFLRRALESHFAFDAVVSVQDGVEAWELCRRDASFKLFLVDLLLPGMDGIKLGRQILELRGSSARVLALSSECDDYTVKEVVRSGILGFVDKPTMDESTLFEAVRTVLEGRVYYSKAVRTVMDRLADASDAYFKVLSSRELEVLRLIAHGMDQNQIAETLGISPFTARRHRLNLSAKLNCKSEAQLMQYALKKGIVKHKSGLGWS